MPPAIPPISGAFGSFLVGEELSSASVDSGVSVFVGRSVADEVAVEDIVDVWLVTVAQAKFSSSGGLTFHSSQ